MRFPALLLLAALAAPVSAQPASLRVFPVRITLAPSRPIATLTVSNTSPVAVALQMGLVAWRQQDGQDRFEPTEQVLANPAIFKIEPGAQQVVRLGLRTPLDGKEGSYRPCCSGLTEVAYQSAAYVDGVPGCWSPPLRV